MGNINIENQIYMKDIVESSFEGRLVYFIGSGFSKSINNNNKDWQGMIKILMNKLDTDEKDYLKVAQMYYDNYGQIALKNEIKRNMHLKIENKFILDNLFNTKPSMIFTTNWDNILQKYINDENYILWKTIAKDRDIIELKQNDKLLVKVHGDLENDNFVFTEESYMQYDKNFKLIRNLIINTLATKTIVFLGYSFSDPDIKQIVKFFDEAEVNQISMYYVNTSDKIEKNVNDFEKKYFDKYGLKVIDYDCADRVDNYFKEFNNIRDENRTIINNIKEDSEYFSNEKYIYINHIYDLVVQEKAVIEILFHNGLVLYFMGKMEENSDLCVFYNDLIKYCKDEDKNIYVLRNDSLYYKYFSMMRVNYIYFEIDKILISIEVKRDISENFYEFISYKDKKENFYKMLNSNIARNVETEYIYSRARNIYNKIDNRIKDIHNINKEKTNKLLCDIDSDSIKSLINFNDKKHFYVIEKLINLTDINELYMKISERLYEENKKINRKQKYIINYKKFDELKIFAAKIYSIILFAKENYYPLERYIEFNNMIKCYCRYYFVKRKNKRQVLLDRFTICIMASYLQYKDIVELIDGRAIKCNDADIEWFAKSIIDLEKNLSKDSFNDNFYSLETYTNYLLNVLYISTFIRNEKLFKLNVTIFEKLLTSFLSTTNHIEIINYYFKYQYEKFNLHCNEDEISRLIDLLITKVIGDGKIETSYAELREIQGNHMYYIFVVAENCKYQYNNTLLVEKLVVKIHEALNSKQTDFYDVYSVTQYFLRQIYFISAVEVKKVIKKFYSDFVIFVKNRANFDLHDIDIYITLAADFVNENIDFATIYSIIEKNIKISSILYDIKNSIYYYIEKRKKLLSKEEIDKIKMCIKLIDKYIKQFEDRGIKFR